MMRSIAMMAGLAIAGPSASGAQPETRKVTVEDPRNHAAAYTLEIPTDWRFAGEVIRPHGCHAYNPSIPLLKFTAQAADGVTAVVLLAGATWSWSSVQPATSRYGSEPCKPIDIDTAAGFLLNIALPSLRPEAKILEVLPVPPEQQARLREQLDQLRHNAESLAKQFKTPPGKQTVEGARARIQYERGGQPVEEMIGVSISCFETSTTPAPKKPAVLQRTCSLGNTTIVRAPQGHLDELIDSGVVKGISTSLKSDASWQTGVNAELQDGIQHSGTAPYDAGDGDTALPTDQAPRSMFRPSDIKPPVFDHQVFKDPNGGGSIEVNGAYNRAWHSEDGPIRVERFGPMGDFRTVHDTVNQIWIEPAVK